MKVVTLVVEIDEEKAKWLKAGKMKYGISLIEKADGDVLEVLRDCQEEMDGIMDVMEESGVVTMTPEEAMNLIQEAEDQEGMPLLRKRPGNNIPRC